MSDKHLDTEQKQRQLGLKEKIIGTIGLLIIGTIALIGCSIIIVFLFDVLRSLLNGF